MDKFKVMIVDDEVDFLETIVKRLRARSIDVTGVESGYQGPGSPGKRQSRCDHPRRQDAGAGRD